MIYIWAFLGAFVSVFLKGFQHKNVISNMYGSIVVTSYLMAVVDVLLIGLISKAGWEIAFASGTGASLGMALSIFLHNRFFSKSTEGEQLD